MHIIRLQIQYAIEWTPNKSTHVILICVGGRKCLKFVNLMLKICSKSMFYQFKILSLLCMTHMYDSYVWLICMTHMYDSYVWIICMTRHQTWLNLSIKSFFAPKNWNFVSLRFHSFYESYTMLHTLYERWYSVEVLLENKWRKSITWWRWRAK